ncbi:MAG: GIY-YIG nuclease family protein [Gammaproteobacteria bacterium]|nr:GIY-YIG nuclease family protein [Gammaproteobacteria bacterium]
MQAWFVYIVHCADGCLYTGITTDLERRINEHNDPATKLGARFTRGRQPVTLVYQQQLADRSSATRREMEIKALNKQQKQALIEDPAINQLK